MRLIFLCLITLLLNSQSDEMLYYKQALPIILNSAEYKEYHLGKDNYNVSPEIVSFSIFGFFFNDELKKEIINNTNVVDVVRINNELLKLNSREKGKVKIFFSEIKDDVFFVETFVYKHKNVKHSGKIFGRTQVYMFKIQDKFVLPIRVRELHYN